MALHQPATFNESWSDERVKSYLYRHTPSDENKDFYTLYRAYKHMRSSDFSRFLVFFKADGLNINAKNNQGNTFLDLVKQHAHSTEFVKLVVNA